MTCSEYFGLFFPMCTDSSVVTQPQNKVETLESKNKMLKYEISRSKSKIHGTFNDDQDGCKVVQDIFIDTEDTFNQCLDIQPMFSQGSKLI